MSRQINLYNPALREVRDWLRASTVAAGLGFIAAGAVALAAFGWQGARESQAELARMEMDLKARKDEAARLGASLGKQRSPELDGQLVALESQLQARERLAQFLGRGETAPAAGFSEYMRAFARQTTSGVWLTGFVITPQGGDMTLSGRALDAELVPGYIERLGREPALQGRTFAQITLRGPVERPAAKEASEKAEPIFHEFALTATERRTEGGSRP